MFWNYPTPAHNPFAYHVGHIVSYDGITTEMAANSIPKSADLAHFVAWEPHDVYLRQIKPTAFESRSYRNGIEPNMFPYLSLWPLEEVVATCTSWKEVAGLLSALPTSVQQLELYFPEVDNGSTEDVLQLLRFSQLCRLRLTFRNAFDTQVLSQTLPKLSELQKLEIELPHDVALEFAMDPPPKLSELQFYIAQRLWEEVMPPLAIKPFKFKFSQFTNLSKLYLSFLESYNGILNVNELPPNIKLINIHSYSENDAENTEEVDTLLEALVTYPSLESVDLWGGLVKDAKAFFEHLPKSDIVHINFLRLTTQLAVDHCMQYFPESLLKEFLFFLPDFTDVEQLKAMVKRSFRLEKAQLPQSHFDSALFETFCSLPNITKLQMKSTENAWSVLDTCNDLYLPIITQFDLVPAGWTGGLRLTPDHIQCLERFFRSHPTLTSVSIRCDADDPELIALARLAFSLPPHASFDLNLNWPKSWEPLPCNLMEWVPKLAALPLSSLNLYEGWSLPDVESCPPFELNTTYTRFVLGNMDEQKVWSQHIRPRLAANKIRNKTLLDYVSSL